MPLPLNVAFRSRKLLRFFRSEMIRRSPSSTRALKVVRSRCANLRASSKRLFGICMDVFIYLHILHDIPRCQELFEDAFKLILYRLFLFAASHFSPGVAE